jgi:hypothetical protein
MSANDNFANRIFLGGLPVSTTGSNIGDTGEVDEPGQSGPINSAWWSWTAPSTGTVTFDTQGSNFDTWLSLFNGFDLTNLSLVAADDDGGEGLTSLLTRSVTAGETYQIAVDGWSGNTGQIQLNITAPPPPNDNFANAIALTDEIANSIGSNHGATGEVGEPAQNGQVNSAWWSWTAPSSGFFQVDTTGSNFDTWLSVFNGSVVDNLSLIGADDDSGPGLTSLYNLNATAGTTYPIAVDGYSNYTLGDINLNIAPTAPPNDNFANRIGLAGETANATGSNVRATEEVGEPTQNGATESVWWTWTAPTNGTYTFDTEGSGYDTYLSLFTGNDFPNLSLVAADDDGGDGLTSLITQSVTAGETYQIAVDGYSSATGPINLNIARIVPPNDNFANRIALAGETANATGSNIGATEEVGEPTQSGATESVWWTWTAPTTETYTFDTIGSDYDTYLSVFTGFDVSSLTLVAADDDGAGYPASLISLNATAGETYQIAVDGFSSSTGQIQLNIAPAPFPAPTAGAANLTETANADTINGLPDTIAGKPAHNTLEGEAGKDPLTGVPGADTLMLPFPESSLSPSDPGTEFADSEKKDLLTQGGVAMNPSSLFSPPANSAVITLEKGVSPVFTEEKGVSPVFTHANGALPGNPALGINSDPFRVPADRYLVGVYEAKPSGFSVA